MKSGTIALAACAAFSLLVVSLPAPAHDVDGAPDCGRAYHDFGDAPEGVHAYPGGIFGKFPTCTSVALGSTQELDCPAVSSPPGVSGYVYHFGDGANYWLGCYTSPAGLAFGVDDEPDGKMQSPAVGVSLCAGIPTDCIEAAWGMTWDQDECWGDGSDSGVRIPSLTVCKDAVVTYTVFNCTQPRTIVLNILVDMNEDGDWNDNIRCPDGVCAYEWAVRNVPVVILPGCNTLVSPAFRVGPRPGHAWMRVTIDDVPVAVDFPWAGSQFQTQLMNGETEDYPVDIQVTTPVLPGSWGKVKAIYRS